VTPKSGPKPLKLETQSLRSAVVPLTVVPADVLATTHRVLLIWGFWSELDACLAKGGQGPVLGPGSQTSDVGVWDLGPNLGQIWPK